MVVVFLARWLCRASCGTEPEGTKAITDLTSTHLSTDLLPKGLSSWKQESNIDHLWFEVSLLEPLPLWIFILAMPQLYWIPDITYFCSLCVFVWDSVIKICWKDSEEIAISQIYEDDELVIYYFWSPRGDRASVMFGIMQTQWPSCCWACHLKSQFMHLLNYCE